MIEIKIIIDKPVEDVWNYFTNPVNWHEWNFGKMIQAEWVIHGLIHWSVGAPSVVKDFNFQKYIRIEGEYTKDTYYFEPYEGGTLLTVEETPKGGSWSDGGAKRKDEWESILKKLKTTVETAGTIMAPVKAGEVARENICECCKRKTNNQYDYYRGNVIGRSSSTNMNTTTTITSYGNLEKVSGYICTKCVDLGNCIGAIFSFIGGLAFMILSIKFHNDTSIWGTIFGAFICLFLLIYFPITVNDIRKDKRTDEKSAAEKLINKARKLDPEKVYFTVAQYNKLKK
jgi:hypothetical protein